MYTFYAFANIALRRAPRLQQSAKGSGWHQEGLRSPHGGCGHRKYKAAELFLGHELFQLIIISLVISHKFKNNNNNNSVLSRQACIIPFVSKEVTGI